jgi:hypothetical protein
MLVVTFLLGAARPAGVLYVSAPMLALPLLLFPAKSAGRLVIYIIGRLSALFSAIDKGPGVH